MTKQNKTLMLCFILEINYKSIPKRNWHIKSDDINRIFGTFVSAFSEHGFDIKPMTLKIMPECYSDSVRENNHHDSLAGKGQNGKDCSLIIGLLRQFFAVTS